MIENAILLLKIEVSQNKLKISDYTEIWNILKISCYFLFSIYS